MTVMVKGTMGQEIWLGNILGLQRESREFMKAAYVHCNSDVLNLCIASSCQIEIIRDMMDNVCTVSNFFNDSPKRTLVLKDKTNKIVPTASRQKLLNVCRTRWIARIDGLKIFRNCYAAILAALDAINKDKASNDADVRQRADGMRKAVCKVHKAIDSPTSISVT